MMRLSSIAFIGFALALLPLSRTAQGEEGEATVTTATTEASGYKLDQLDSRPKPIKQLAPRYPKEQRAAGVEGLVEVKFTVSEHGKVEDIKVLKATDAAFAKSTVTAINQWQFKPGIKDGKPVRSNVSLTIPFKVNSQKSSGPPKAPTGE